MSTYYLILGVLLVVTSGSDCQLYDNRITCHFNKTDGSETELIFDYFFKKVKVLDYRSSLNRFTGYTQYGMTVANGFNTDEQTVLMYNLLANCRFLISFYDPWSTSRTVEPSVHLTAVPPPSGSKHTYMLKCSAYRFFPQGIQVTWSRNGQDVTSDMIYTVHLSDGDLHFQHHSYLEYTPTAGDEVSCMVEHASLPRPKILRWDPSMPMPLSERVQLGIGALGVFLGLVVATAGSLYYRRRPRGVVQTPSTVDLQSMQEPNLDKDETPVQESCM